MAGGASQTLAALSRHLAILAARNSLRRRAAIWARATRIQPSGPSETNRVGGTGRVGGRRGAMVDGFGIPHAAARETSLPTPRFPKNPGGNLAKKKRAFRQEGGQTKVCIAVWKWLSHISGAKEEVTPATQVSRVFLLARGRRLVSTAFPNPTPLGTSFNTRPLLKGLSRVPRGCTGSSNPRGVKRGAEKTQKSGGAETRVFAGK